MAYYGACGITLQLEAPSLSPTPSDSCNVATQHELRNLEAPQARTDSLSEPKLPNPLEFMKSKLVLMVSVSLSFSGRPLLLTELVFLLRVVGSDVV